MNEEKSYNPKANAPAVYIPTWLIQVPAAELSLNAKLLYGRLAQWSNNKGTVNRSTKQLTEEIGSKQRNVERYLKELRGVGLIKTYQKEEGGINYYAFLDHEWIHRKLLDVLENKNDDRGTDKYGGGVPTNVAGGTDKCGGPKVKEVKRSKKPLCVPQATNASAGKKEKLKPEDFTEVWNNEMAGLLIGNNGAKHKPLKILTRGLKSIINEWINAKLTPKDMYIYIRYLKLECFNWAFKPRVMEGGRNSYPTFETFCRLTTYEKQTRRPEFHKHTNKD